MMHVLCEEYDTVYAACLLITSAVLGVDFGYQPTDKGELEYIIQIEPELLDRLKAGEAIQMGLPPNMQKVAVFRVQVGTAELRKVLPTSYSEAADKKPSLGLTPINAPALTAPPDQADTRPALDTDDELAQYTPRSARQLPSGANEPAGSAYSSGTSGTGSTIPGAEQRYGGTSSNFSVPGSSRFGATQTGGTTPIASGQGTGGSPSGTGTSGTAASGQNTPGQGLSGTGTSGTASSGNSSSGTGTSATSPSGNFATDSSRWAPSSQTGNPAEPTSGQTSPSSQAGTGTTNAGSSNSNNNASAGSSSDPYRFNIGNTAAGQQAPDLIGPSDWTSTSGGQNGGTQNNQNGGAPNGGSQYGNNQNGNSQNGNGQNGNTQNGGGTTPNGQNGSGFYNSNNPPYASGGQQHNGSVTPLWPNNNYVGNGTNGNQAPYSPVPNPNYNAANGQYPPGQNPPNNGMYSGNNYTQQPPAGYNNPQAPYGYNPVTGQPLQAPYPGAPVNYLASLPQNQQSPQQPAPSTSNASGNGTNADSAEDADDKQEGRSTIDRDKDYLPSWWPLLAFGFLVSICANGYMWMISQDFQRKYQDLLEDVRDLRTLSDN